MQGTADRTHFHDGVTCNACSRSNFRGKRYKCLNCYHYNLCETCYDAGAHDQFHKLEHAMQCILTAMDYNIYFGGETATQPQSFTCPMCATMGYTLNQLGTHVWSQHSGNDLHVVCPVCAATSGGDPINLRGDLATHLTFDHATSLGQMLDQPPRRSLQRAALTGVLGNVGAPARALLPQRPPPTVSAPHASSPDVQSVGTLTGMLSRMSTGPLATSTLAASRAAVAEIERIRTRLQIARQAFQRRSRPPAQEPRLALALPLEPLPEPLPVAPEPTMVEPPATDTCRFFLAALTEPRLRHSQQRALESERADRSLFVQELLLSALSEQAPAAAQGQRCEPGPTAAASRGDDEVPATGPVPTAAASSENTASTSPESVDPEPTGVTDQELTPP
ncbi:E3 ubiquitin-protein ligase KCMF1-like [Haemaphysalis longicornis]